MTKLDDLTKLPSVKKNDIYPWNVPVQSYLNNLGLFGDIHRNPAQPTFWMRLMVDNEEGEKPVWSGRERSILPELKTISLKERVAQTLAKRIRQLNRRRFVWYCGFLATMIIMIFGWCPIYDSYIVRQGIDGQMITQTFSEEVVHFSKEFKDVATAEEMYDYLLDIYIPALNLGDGAVIADFTNVIGGLRVRQHRVGPNEDYGENGLLNT